MPFVPLISVSQNYGLPSKIVVTDNSTGSDPAIVSRRVYLTTGYNTYLVPSGTTTDYVSWPLVNTSITIDALDKDYALNVVVQFLDSGGGVLYTVNTIVGLTLYNEQELYDLTQDQSSTDIIQDANYYANKMAMRVEIDSGNQAISLAGDIQGAQGCYDRATNFRINKDKYF